ncbi:NADP-dependent 3-hydroxy acid dehydrogenase YdfG [Nonomuraea solani]|uniref:NADP-dependent 3-hydroxy acid dehydrogenase YdfG n=1 Tax=Nonomuraea solani TaxID=1144553 RepID=A0A1H5Y380_9ACTN|nr:SDR family oxidoreductase [Nonomuraea solani]SEG18474.1 NADP-dependent 3-hydroxy acid dehydrogenase YdfG [Nonomuraea solani]
MLWLGEETLIVEVRQGRRVLVTGASDGIGAAVAGHLARDGARVALLARDTARLEDVARRSGGLAITADLTDPPSATRAVEDAAREMGGLDVLVNNAGVFRLGRVADGEIADWRDMLEVNVLGLLAVTQAAIPFLRLGRHPQIVNISSMSGRRVAGAVHGVYSGTKHAVHALGDALRQELHADGIRVTTVSPGIVRTNLGATVRDGELRSDVGRSQVEQGLSPEDVAAQVSYILSVPPDVHLVELAVISSRQQPG